MTEDNWSSTMARAPLYINIEKHRLILKFIELALVPLISESRASAMLSLENTKEIETLSYMI